MTHSTGQCSVFRPKRVRHRSRHDNEITECLIRDDGLGPEGSTGWGSISNSVIWAEEDRPAFVSFRIAVI